ncbi:unnamed protein product [Candida verbasci]|uniref:Thioester reductase (TE) domain-containing protein n=1 Tax=Candida verbasci TaxID=1227364 RepID=A0A9W4TZ75_9ASCO|nr:unnamed protein product [Candida verbasci]
MASSTFKSIAVFGGNGFLGHKICEIGIRNNYNVTSFSRKGEPPQSVIHQPWVSKVNWEKADIFNPKTYGHKLKDFNSVVHSIGLLFENLNYKSSINTNFNILNDLQNLTNSFSGSNPMEKAGYKLTYESLQKDSAVILANAFIENQKESPRNYVYISADKNPPIIPKNYIVTKREAEFELSCKRELNTIIMRPGAMYDETHEGNLTKRDILMRGLRFGVGLKNCTIGNSIGFVNDLVRPVVSTEQVANTIFKKLQEEDSKGVVKLEEIVKN